MRGADLLAGDDFSCALLDVVVVRALSRRGTALEDASWSPSQLWWRISSAGCFEPGSRVCVTCGDSLLLGGFIRGVDLLAGDDVRYALLDVVVVRALSRRGAALEGASWSPLQL